MPFSACSATHVSVKWSIYERREPGGTAAESPLLCKPMAPCASRKAHIKREKSAGAEEGGEGLHVSMGGGEGGRV